MQHDSEPEFRTSAFIKNHVEKKEEISTHSYK